MFAGIGGFRTGLTNAGDFFMPVGWCEKDKHAQKAYRLLYGTEGEYFCDDARIINPADMPDFDLICGGFPCQPFSVAGQRLGFADERGTLFHEICRLAEARHPKYLLLENVPGLLTHEGGQTFLAILTALGQLGYYLSQLPLYVDSKYQSEKQIQGLNTPNADIFMPIEEAKSHLKDLAFTLPYSRQVKEQAQKGTLYEKTTDKKFQSRITEIARKVVEYDAD